MGTVRDREVYLRGSLGNDTDVPMGVTKINNSPVTVLEARGYFVVFEDGPEPAIKLQGLAGQSAVEITRCRAYLVQHRDRIIEEMRTYWQDVGRELRPAPPFNWPYCRSRGECRPGCPKRRGHFCPK